MIREKSCLPEDISLEFESSKADFLKCEESLWLIRDNEVKFKEASDFISDQGKRLVSWVHPLHQIYHQALEHDPDRVVLNVHMAMNGRNYESLGSNNCFQPTSFRSSKTSSTESVIIKMKHWLRSTRDEVCMLVEQADRVEATGAIMRMMGYEGMVLVMPSRAHRPRPKGPIGDSEWGWMMADVLDDLGVESLIVGGMFLRNSKNKPYNENRIFRFGLDVMDIFAFDGCVSAFIDKVLSDCRGSEFLNLRQLVRSPVTWPDR